MQQNKYFLGQARPTSHSFPITALRVVGVCIPAGKGKIISACTKPWSFTLFIKKWHIQYYFYPFKIFQMNKIGGLHSSFLPRLKCYLEQMVLSIISFWKWHYCGVITYCRFGPMQLSPHRASMRCSPSSDSGLALKRRLQLHSRRALRRFTRLWRKLWILSMINASKNSRNKLTSSSKRC